MILQSLNELYDRLADDEAYGLSKPGYSIQKISFRIIIRMNGTLFDAEDARSKDEKGKQQSTPLLVPGDAKPSGAGINPGLLWDNQTYMLGRQPEDKKEGFGLERFNAFRERHLKLESIIKSERFSAICRFLEQWTPDQLENYPKLSDVGNGFGVFRILGERKDINEDPKVIEWWTTLLDTPVNEDQIGQCLITGEKTPIARLHPKIKGIPGAQAAGASIVSFNDSAYESYAKKQSYNGPVSEKAAFRYGATLNALLTGRMHAKHRVRVGDTTCVFWTGTKTIFEDCLADIFGMGSNAPDEVQDANKRKDVELLLKAIRDGNEFKGEQELETDAPFYILGLAPNAARLSVRFFHCSTTTELLKRLHDHQQCMKMVREFPEPKGKRHADPEFPAVWQILRETARVSDEISPILGGAILRSIIEGTPYPLGLFNAIVRRIHLDRRVNYLKAATLKAILNRNFKNQEQYNMKPALDKEHPSEAYHLGRLFAIYEQSQRQAHDFNLDRTIRESHFGSASATPAAVFSRLHRLHIHHLRKLKKGSQKYFEDWSMEILQKFKTDESGVADLPSALDLKEQGVFSIGYYHQMHEMRHKEEKEQNI